MEALEQKKTVKELQREYWEKFRKETKGMSAAQFINYIQRSYEK